MEKPILPEEIMKLYEGYEMVDNPEPIVYHGLIEDFLNNGYMTFEEFLNKVTKLV